MKKIIVLSTVIAMSAGVAVAVDSTGSGNWTNTAIWAGGTVPGVGDIANIKFGHAITNDSVAEVGQMYMVGNTRLDIRGGELTTTKDGGKNGQILLDTKTAPINVTVSGFGKFNPQGYLKCRAGDKGFDNTVEVSFGQLIMGGWTEWGFVGTQSNPTNTLGKARLHIKKQGDVKMWGKSNIMTSNSVLKFTMQTNGTVSALNLMKFDGFLQVDPGAQLRIDMSGMDTDDVGAVGSEILLVNVFDPVNTSPTAITGPFDVTLFGDEAVTEQYEVTYTATGENGAANSVGLRVVEPPVTVSAYEAWTNSYGLVEGPAGDDDDDGLSNLYEFGAGGNPTNSADTGIASTYSLNPDGSINWFQYVYPMQTNVNSGLAYSLEVNNDLVNGTWTNAYYEVTGTGTTANAAFYAVTNRLSTAVENQQFIRLIIELN